MAGFAIAWARVMRRYAHKAQTIVVAAAVFDRQGRILVSPAGLVPSEKITDAFLEKVCVPCSSSTSSYFRANQVT